MSVSQHTSLPVVALPHLLQAELEKVQRAAMESRCREFRTPEEWVASGNAARLEALAEAHPDVLVSFTAEGLQRVQREAGIA